MLGVKGIVLGSTSSTAETPRAHITNMATMGKVFHGMELQIPAFG